MKTFLQAKTFTKKHFFFFTKRKPVLKEKTNCFFDKTFFVKESFLSSFGKAFLSKKRFDRNTRLRDGESVQHIQRAEESV